MRQRIRTRQVLTITATAVLALVCNGAFAQRSTVEAELKKANKRPEEILAESIKRTQGGARVNFTSSSVWDLKAENLVPRGHNPYYFPLKPGVKFIMEMPGHPWGCFRKEIVVLEETETFDVPGIGKFECAVVQEEEFFDGVYDQQALNWFCIDKTTNAMYAFGELSWEIDNKGRKVFVGTWRVGEPDGNGIAEPGLLMPGMFNVGARYAYEAHEAEAFGYTENMESGITMTVPAGTFKNVIRVREFSLVNPSDITDKWWAPGVGILKDTSDGELVASTELGSDVSSFGYYHRNPVKVVVPPVVIITNGLQASAIAVKEIPGKVVSVRPERLGRKNVYTVELISDKDGLEWDVFIDIATGKVVATDN